MVKNFVKSADALKALTRNQKNSNEFKVLATALTV